MHQDAGGVVAPGWAVLLPSKPRILASRFCRYTRLLRRYPVLQLLETSQSTALGHKAGCDWLGNRSGLILTTALVYDYIISIDPDICHISATCMCTASTVYSRLTVRLVVAAPGICSPGFAIAIVALPD